MWNYKFTTRKVEKIQKYKKGKIMFYILYTKIHILFLANDIPRRVLQITQSTLRLLISRKWDNT